MNIIIINTTHTRPRALKVIKYSGHFLISYYLQPAVEKKTPVGGRIQNRTEFYYQNEKKRSHYRGPELFDDRLI